MQTIDVETRSRLRMKTRFLQILMTLIEPLNYVRRLTFFSLGTAHSGEHKFRDVTQWPISTLIRSARYKL